MHTNQAHLVLKLRIENGVPVFDSMLVTSTEACKLGSQQGFVFAELFAVDATNGFAAAHDDLVAWLATARGWEWTAMHLKR